MWLTVDTITGCCASTSSSTESLDAAAVGGTSVSAAATGVGVVAAETACADVADCSETADLDCAVEAAAVAPVDESVDAAGAFGAPVAPGTLITTVTGDGVAAGPLEAGAADNGAPATTGVLDTAGGVGVADGLPGVPAPAVSTAHAAANAAAAGSDGLPTIGAPTTPVPQEGSG